MKKKCTHKTLHDFKTAEGWRCSGCGKVGPWGRTWLYFGNLECSRCWLASIEAVACSVDCMRLAQRSEATGAARS